MRNILFFVTNHPITTLTTIAIWVVCLMPVPETPLSGVTLMDKWVHIAMFLTLGLIATFEHLRVSKPLTHRQRIACAFLFPSITGGFIELAQAFCTRGMRSGEWLDFIADAIGAMIAWLFVEGWFSKKRTR